MSLGGVKELRFAYGYYQIGWDKPGLVTFKEGTPQEIQDRFWEVWPSFREKVLNRQREGYLDSYYPYLPEDDPEENKMHYIGKRRKSTK